MEIRTSSTDYKPGPVSRDTATSEPTKPALLLDVIITDACVNFLRINSSGIELSKSVKVKNWSCVMNFRKVLVRNRVLGQRIRTNLARWKVARQAMPVRGRVNRSGEWAGAARLPVTSDGCLLLQKKRKHQRFFKKKFCLIFKPAKKEAQISYDTGHRPWSETPSTGDGSLQRITIAFCPMTFPNFFTSFSAELLSISAVYCCGTHFRSVQTVVLSVAPVFLYPILL